MNGVFSLRGNRAQIDTLTIQRFKRGVAELLSALHEKHQETAVMAFEVRDAEQAVLGRFEGYLTLVDGVSVEQIIRVLREGGL